MNPWKDYPVPPMRHEALYGDRVVRCFADRPSSLLALFDEARRSAPAQEAMVCNGQRWTYAETAAWADRLAGALAAVGRQANARILFSPDLVQGLAELLHDVEPVEDVDRLPHPLPDHLQVGLPHVAADEAKVSRAGSELVEELVEARGGTVDADPQEALAVRIDLVHDGEVLVATVPEHLVDADRPRFGRPGLGELFLHVELVDLLDGLAPGAGEGEPVADPRG